MLNSVVVTFLFSLSLPPSVTCTLVPCSFFLSFSHSPTISRHRELFFAFYFFEYFSFLLLCVSHFCSLSGPRAPSRSRTFVNLLWLYVYIFVTAMLLNERSREMESGWEEERVRVSLIHIRIVSIWLSKGTFALLKLLLFSSHLHSIVVVVVGNAVAAAAAVVSISVWDLLLLFLVVFRLWRLSFFGLCIFHFTRSPNSVYLSQYTYLYTSYCVFVRCAYISHLGIHIWPYLPHFPFHYTSLYSLSCS